MKTHAERLHHIRVDNRIEHIQHMAVAGAIAGIVIWFICYVLVQLGVL